MCCLLCVCGLSLPDFVYPSKSLPIMVADLLVWDQGTAPGGEGATKLCFLSDLSPAASVWHRVFPPQLIKSLTRWCKASSVLFGFKNSYQLKFRWLFRTLVGRSTENLCWGQEQVGSTSTYLASIFQIPWFLHILLDFQIHNSILCKVTNLYIYVYIFNHCIHFSLM